MSSNATKSPGLLHLLGKRRRFLVNKGMQLRAGGLVVGATLLLLVLLNLTLYTARQRSTLSILSDSPELAVLLHAQDRAELVMVLVASGVFLLGVFVVTILETHRTAGAALNLTRHLRRVEQGVYGERVLLRKGDNLRELERAFNDMTRTLEQRAWQDAETLETLAGVAESLGGAEEAREMAGTLRREAGRKRGFETSHRGSGESSVLVNVENARTRPGTAGPPRVK